MRYLVPSEIKSEARVSKGIYVSDLFFLIFYALLSWALSVLVYGPFMIPYVIFSVFCGLYLTTKSGDVPRRRWQLALVLLSRDKAVYHPMEGFDDEEQ